MRLIAAEVADQSVSVNGSLAASACGLVSQGAVTGQQIVEARSVCAEIGKRSQRHDGYDCRGTRWREQAATEAGRSAASDSSEGRRRAAH
jgi:hypothetical protein